ncbi:MAG: SNF2-related protein [Candidatus Binatia bacterium]
MTTNLAAEVDRLSRERGYRYFLSGAVDSLEGDAWRVDATVQGTRRYQVNIARAQDSFEVSCSCPYYDRELVTCKHIWATLLAAEQQGHLGGGGESAPRQIREEIPGLFPEKKRPAAAKKPRALGWKQQLQGLLTDLEAAQARSSNEATQERQFIYLLHLRETVIKEQLNVEIAQREKRMNGSWGKLKTRRIRPQELAALTDASDKRIMSILFGAKEETSYGYSSYYYDSAPTSYTLAQPLWEVVLPLMCATGRCFLRASFKEDGLAPLQWEEGNPWELWLEVMLDEAGERYLVHGSLRRGEAEMDLQQPQLFLSGGLVFYEDRIARLQDFGAFGWISLLRAQGHLSVPKNDVDQFLGELLRLPRRPRLALPEELKLEEVSCRPKPCLVIKPGKPEAWSRARLLGELSFSYDGQVIPCKYAGQVIHQTERRRVINRDFETEAAAEQRLKQLGFRRPYWKGADTEYELLPDRLAKVVRALSHEGWRVEAEGKLYRQPGAMRFQVNSAVDWFEIDGGASFGETTVALPKLLRALKQGEPTVRLDDGTFGILPEEWVKKYGLLAGLGSIEGNRLRFTRQQIGLLDALIAAEPEVSADATFERLRQELYSFAGVEAADPTADFAGHLRDYQREGLGWLGFLQRFGFGGCLADDMGLGKTIQVLALLESRRELHARNERRSPRPSLVVVPRSLVFHWKREAGQFAPKLRLLDHTGAWRLKPGDHFSDYDLVITTYGTLRRDALHFKAQRFDYCILDEAQAIKNAGTLSAKAARLLRADHRLAMSGTPVENHLGELWSLFEFLNPGMLGSATVFGRAGRNPDTATRNILARALRPFVLRRTKSQVARELPAKTEQTIFCDLEGREKKLYDELRAFYRARLLKDVEHEDMSRVKFQALEALLRLRQAACHPGLIDKSKAGEPSAKVDTLIAQLDQVREEGHKVLVFSQFTSLLAIVRNRLDKDKVAYAYLDGRTRDREARVDQFQNDASVKIFLISLKAGGLGLNLHAAEYVYLLDPWWNPAGEAQAIDRAHRIGQTRQVFAYRLIARGTVEEKVLELQKSKRELADAIITADNSLMHNLTRQDLELLLS